MRFEGLSVEEHGPEVFVEAGATVGEGAYLQRAVVLRGATIPPGAVVMDQVVGGK